jgi:hypothetical protein
MFGSLRFLFTLSLAFLAERDPVEVLAKATEKLAARRRSIPNCTCVETISRDYFRPAAATLPRACSVLLEQRKHPTLDLVLRHVLTDRLRLDVAVTERGEMFSWVGANKFEDSGIERLVTVGPVGTGAFSDFLSVVLLQDAKEAPFEGYVVADGRNLMEYSYRVRKGNSHYKVRLEDSSFYSGYSGTFRLDPNTSDVVELTVVTDELPPITDDCKTITKLDFHLVQIGKVQVVLPEHAEQRFVYPTGEETQNDMTFANCREYLGESTISFSPDTKPADSGGRANTPIRIPTIPAGLPLALELTTPIQTDTAAAGDSFAGKLVKPLRDARQKLLAAKGSIVQGRLLRVENIRLPKAAVVLVLQLESIEIDHAKAPIAAIRDWTLARPQTTSKGKKGVSIILPPRGAPHSAVFTFDGEHVMVDTGFRTDWRTVN